MDKNGRRRPSAIGELFTALAFVNANDLVFAGIDLGMGYSKAEALWIPTQFERRRPNICSLSSIICRLLRCSSRSIQPPSK